MLYDLIYPENEKEIWKVPVIVAAYFDKKELLSLGVKSDAFEVDQTFIEENEFVKVFKLWDSPLYLRKFYIEHKEFFDDDYWNGITEDEFVEDVTASLNRIKAELIDLFLKHKFHSKMEPLTPEEKDLRLSQSIRVKIKQRWIHDRLAFRFYAIEIERGQCYLITGGSIKIHEDMLKAPNTTIEINKLKYALNIISGNNIDTKELFLDYILR